MLLVLISSQPFVRKYSSHCATQLTNLPNQACGCMPAEISTDPNSPCRMQTSARGEDDKQKRGGAQNSNPGLSSLQVTIFWRILPMSLWTAVSPTFPSWLPSWVSLQFGSFRFVPCVLSQLSCDLPAGRACTHLRVLRALRVCSSNLSAFCLSLHCVVPQLWLHACMGSYSSAPCPTSCFRCRRRALFSRLFAKFSFLLL